MKTVLLSILTLLLLCIVSSKAQQPTRSQTAKLTTFKGVPDEMMGCGDCYYLSKADKKKERFLAIDNFQDILFYLNNVPVKFRISGQYDKKERTYKYKEYSIIIKNTYHKNAGYEYYILRAMITLKQGGKVIWQQNVIGDGGC